MIKKPIKSELEKQYNYFKSISKTSRYYNTSNPTIRSWLIGYNIPQYNHHQSVLADFQLKTKESPPRKELETIYRNTSIDNMEKLYGVGQATIYSWLKDYGIERLSISEKIKKVKHKAFNTRFNQTKKTIEKDYESCGCMGVLANHYGCSITTIKKLFKMHDVDTKFAKSSKGQQEIMDFLQEHDIDYLKNNRSIISPLELDIVIPNKKIAIEYCGNYYHSETWGNKSRNYHLIKHNRCLEAGYKLITIFESEWKTKQPIIKSILKHKLGLTTIKISARQTTFQEISYKNIKQFELDNHLQGTRPANKYYGLYYKGELVMAASIGKSRFNKKYENELVRMTAKKDTAIIGGISKLFANMKIKNCISYADNRYGDGVSYTKVGFVNIGKSSPNYFYFHKTDHDTLYSRNKFQKHKIKDVDIMKSEYQNMLDKGYDRIWDCGNSIYVLNVP